jgi:hypothetical protein
MVGTSLVVSSLPASAAVGDLTIKPTTGVAYSVFNDDVFALTAVPNATTIVSDATLSYKINNPDQAPLVIDFPDNLLTLNGADTATFTGIKSTGETVPIFSGGLAVAAAFPTTVSASRSTASDQAGRILVEFDDADIVSVVISGLNFTGDTTPTITPVLADGDDTDDSTNLTKAELEALTAMGLGDGNVSINVQAWLDTNADTSDIDPGTASDVETITWYDPANVSIISEVKRMTASGKTFGTAIGTSTTAVSRQDFLMGVAGAGKNALTGSMKFNVPMNFSQIQLADIKMSTTNGAAVATSTVIRAIPAGTNSGGLLAAGDLEVLTASNGKSSDVNGEILFRAWTNALFVAGNKLQVSFQHNDTDGNDVAPVYNSAAFTVTTQTAATTAVDGRVSVAPAAGTSFTTTSATLRSGVTAVTYTAQAQTTSNAASVSVANIPFIARVEASDFLPANETLTVSGTTTVINQSNEAVFVSGLTNSDGKFSVTVTAAQAAAATSYNVEFWISNGGTVGTWTSLTEQSATYGSTNANSFKAVNAVNSSANPTVSFSVEDAFGGAVSQTSTGKVYSVELKAPDTTKLKAYAQVVNGTVSFTFESWLAAGESDVLTARLYTGTSTTPLAADYTAFSANVTLYGPVVSAAVVLTASEITGVVVEYNDFITGKKDKVGPTAQTGTDITGAVVDANGAGIPGAPVTLSAEGVQFLSGTTFSIGSVELVTDAAGSFTAEVWTHTKSATGVVITATNGAGTDTVKLISDLPTSVNRGNLVFTVDMPAAVVFNTTYSFTASVQDVWGNPVDGAVVQFDGFGSAQFNGLNSVTRSTNRSGEATVFLRSLKDVDGLSAIEVSVTSVNHDGLGATTDIALPIATDVATTSWDESKWSNLFEAQVNFLETAPAAAQKVNAGSFKGYVALYAKGYEGSRMSAKVGNDWVVVPSVPAATNDLFRAVEFVGAGVDISVRIYIDRVLVATIPLLTK